MYAPRGGSATIVAQGQEAPGHWRRWPWFLDSAEVLMEMAGKMGEGQSEPLHIRGAGPDGEGHGSNGDILGHIKEAPHAVEPPPPCRSTSSRSSWPLVLVALVS